MQKITAFPHDRYPIIEQIYIRQMKTDAGAFIFIKRTLYKMCLCVLLGVFTIRYLCEIILLTYPVFIFSRNNLLYLDRTIVQHFLTVSLSLSFTALAIKTILLTLEVAIRKDTRSISRANANVYGPLSANCLPHVASFAPCGTLNIA